ncbi:MAG: alpha/beta family hydrolase [Nocardioides sp.]|uniref:alpha/beta hydrolase family protein n=1 Tax=Nocardioides sp. TaxID=35761 RepID=UPI003EFCEFE5
MSETAAPEADHVVDVETPHGPGRLHVHAAEDPVAVLLASHGAGGGVDARDLVALAEFLPGQGIAVALFEQPWRVAGRKIATAPPTLDVAFVAAAEALREVVGTDVPLVVGGRSAGARSACRTARQLGATGCLALSFPLHPPGRPEKSRVDELRGTGCTTLVVQGERDPMGRPEEFPRDWPELDFAVVPGADHGLKVPARGQVTQDEAMGIVVEAALEWIIREAAGGAVELEVSEQP